MKIQCAGQWPIAFLRFVNNYFVGLIYGINIQVEIIIDDITGSGYKNRCK